MKSNVRTICVFGIMLALYVVLSSFLHIPTGIGNTWLDMGYIVFGFMLACAGPWAAIIGVAGVFLENVMFAGWISYSWMAGQLVIGIVCGLTYQKVGNKILVTIISVLACLAGVGFVKTAIEVALGYGVWAVKLPKNIIISLVDCVTLMVGYSLAQLPQLKKVTGR